MLTGLYPKSHGAHHVSRGDPHVEHVDLAGKMSAVPPTLAEILAAKDRAASPGSAPASGLYLMRVHYGGQDTGH